MNAKEVLQRIGDLGAILVVRADSEEDALAGVRAVVEGGIRAIEVTFTVPGAPSVIHAIHREMGDSVLLGAGTVMHQEDAEDAVDAGATFLVAPNTDERVIGAAKRFGVPILPGAFTPSEVVRAWDLGADAVKIFPASLGGAAYIKALRAPLPHIPMVPTGGVDEKTVGDFVKAGAYAVGAGGSLFDTKKIKEKKFKEMTETAARFVAALKAAREE
ncbi:MAG: bifunctional 4-hydroxy-2-oxoglutarate aldolase/2-dehydro-3-deoxy-phosphogluconate aldolase [Planctomycetes bacterium]|nr:bifunctional 4-hydroxy-2-oxoglutarate aldolase/2-dehydro-3-deoxy-phosphogluconate aldolase [Planctomycetota bacterium]